MTKRSVVIFVGVIAMIYAAWKILGPPPIFALVGSLSQVSVTSTEVTIIIPLILWAIILLLAILALVSDLGRAKEFYWLKNNHNRAIAFMILGLSVLVIGMIHHSLTSFNLCCGGSNKHLEEVLKIVP